MWVCWAYKQGFPSQRRIFVHYILGSTKKLYHIGGTTGDLGLEKIVLERRVQWEMDVVSPDKMYGPCLIAVKNRNPNLKHVSGRRNKRTKSPYW